MAMETESPSNPLVQLVETINQQPPPNDETLLDCLAQLNIVASNDTHNFARICPSINVDVVFALIDRHSSTTRSRGRDQDHVIGTSCEVLRNVFKSMTTIKVMDKYGKFMHTAHTCHALNVLCLQQILRLAEEDNFSYFMSTPNLIQLTVHFLCEENTETSTISVKIMKKLVDLSGNGWLFCDDFLRLFQHLLATKNSVIKFRIYDVFVDYVSKYPEYIEEAKRTHIFGDLVKVIMNSDDILSQLNALEMLSQIAVSSPQGLDFVQEQGIMGWISNTLAKSEDDPLVSFLLPGCIKFFGVLCGTNPLVIIPQYKHILKKIFEDVNNEDPSVSCLCTETVAFICSKGEGLKVLYGSEPDALKEVIRTMTRTISSPGEDDYVRERTLLSLTSMFSHDPNDVQLSNIGEKLYRYLSDSPMSYVFKLIQIPFAEIRHGGFALLKLISRYSWVEQDMMLCAGFLEYLLDRKTEREKDGHELKFEIIKHLSNSATALGNFGPAYFEKLQTYVEQGPFYTESHVSVSFDGDQ